MTTSRFSFKSLPVIFSITLFTSAGLLFLIEPMIAKMILPLLGGTPAVWNTCMMFFQAMLLAGYGYAHLLSTKAGISKQILIQTIILILACIVLPSGISHKLIPSGEENPIASILLILLTSVGLPFFVLSSTAPLLQKWFASTGHPSAKDPYFLYSASNIGSILALISYPILIEPGLALADQSRFWMAGYLTLGILTLCCAYLTWRNLSVCLGKNENTVGQDVIETCMPDSSITNFKDRFFWTILAFVPSSLMLGVTTFLTTDIAAIPLFWIIPLSLYLFSFIIVFAKMPDMLHRIMTRMLPVSLTLLVFLNYADTGMANGLSLLCI